LSRKVAQGFRQDGQKGLFAIAEAQHNEVLISYDGPVIDHATRYSIQIDDHKHIEGTEESNVFLNHSCAPNAYVDWNGPCLRALRDLKAGEEITCNYLTTDYELHDKFLCTCGSASCYGEIKGFKYLTRHQQLELEPFLPPFMKRKLAGE
jgi:hypothetical protein